MGEKKANSEDIKPEDYTVVKPFFYKGDKAPIGDTVALLPDQFELVKDYVKKGA